MLIDNEKQKFIGSLKLFSMIAKIGLICLISAVLSRNVLYQKSIQKWINETDLISAQNCSLSKTKDSQNQLFFWRFTLNDCNIPMKVVHCASFYGEIVSIAASFFHRVLMQAIPTNKDIFKDMDHLTQYEIFHQHVIIPLYMTTKFGSLLEKLLQHRFGGHWRQSVESFCHGEN